MNRVLYNFLNFNQSNLWKLHEIKLYSWINRNRDTENLNSEMILNFYWAKNERYSFKRAFFNPEIHETR